MRPHPDLPAGSADRTPSERLLALPDMTTLVADVLDEVPGAGAVLPAALLPRTGSRRLCGPAAVLLLRPAAAGESISHDPLLRTAAPGSVGVIDAGGHLDGAVLGGRLARRGIAAGLLGYVVDGAVRDVEDLDGLELPVWSRSTHPAGARHALTPVDGVTTVAVGGVAVHRGDLVAADANGVVVVRAAAVQEVCRLTEQNAAREAGESYDG